MAWLAKQFLYNPQAPSGGCTIDLLSNKLSIVLSCLDHEWWQSLTSLNAARAARSHCLLRKDDQR